MSAFGRDAAWSRNIEAAPIAEVVTGSIRRVLSRLLGRYYDGSEAHRRRLAAQLPIIAFRPRR